MLKIFEQIFGLGTKSAQQYPDELVRRATERAIDATDPRIRILPGYEKKMRGAVLHAIDSVVHLVDTLSAPMPMCVESWGSEPIMGTLFASKDSLRKAIACDCACRDFASAHSLQEVPVTALLLTRYSEKQTFGYDQIGDRTVSDVPLTVASFDEHRLIGLATNEAETKRQLQLRAFDYLLALALAEIAAVKEQRQDLQTRKRLLQAKLDIVNRSSGNVLDHLREADRGDLQKKMDEVEAALREAGADDTVLQRNLALVVDLLGKAQERLWLEKRTLHIDNLHYLRPADHRQAFGFPLQLLHDAGAKTAAVQLVAIAPATLAGR